MVSEGPGLLEQILNSLSLKRVLPMGQGAAEGGLAATWKTPRGNLSPAASGPGALHRALRQLPPK